MEKYRVEFNLHSAQNEVCAQEIPHPPSPACLHATPKPVLRFPLTLQSIFRGYPGHGGRRESPIVQADLILCIFYLDESFAASLICKLWA